MEIGCRVLNSDVIGIRNGVLAVETGHFHFTFSGLHNSGQAFPKNGV